MQFNLMVSVNPTHFHWTGLGSLTLTMREQWPWTRKQQWPCGPGWERQLFSLVHQDLEEDSCPLTELTLLLCANELVAIRVLSVKKLLIWGEPVCFWMKESVRLWPKISPSSLCGASRPAGHVQGTLKSPVIAHTLLRLLWLLTYRVFKAGFMQWLLTVSA